MRKLLSIIATCLLFSLVLPSALADTLRIAGPWIDTDRNGDVIAPAWYSAWQQACPDVSLSIEPGSPYDSVAGLSAAVDSGAAPDVMLVNSFFFDLQELMASGALLDLSSDPELAALVAEMYPAYAEAASLNGALYGIPCDISFSGLCYTEPAWTKAGYTAADAPTSFSSLLDFLEGWVERCRTAPVPDVCVNNMFDKLTETSYITFLTEHLLFEYSYYRMAQDEPLRYDTPEIVALLERIRAVGRALYEVDRPKTSEYCLLEDLFGGQHILRSIPSRVSDDEPPLIPVHMDMLCIPASCRNPEAARAFIRLYMETMRSGTAVTERDFLALLARAMLFPDATGAVPNYHHPDEPKLTVEQLADYRALVPRVRVISLYNELPFSRATRELTRQFAAGTLTAQQFAAGIDRQPTDE